MRNSQFNSAVRMLARLAALLLQACGSTVGQRLTWRERLYRASSEVNRERTLSAESLFNTGPNHRQASPCAGSQVLHARGVNSGDPPDRD